MQSGYDSLPGLQESPLPVRSNSDVDLAILKLQEQVKQLTNVVARLQRVIEERPYQMIQALPAQATGVLGSHTDSCASNLSYMTALSMPSRNNSARSDCSNDYGSLDCGPQISDSETPVQAASTNSSYNRRCYSLPAMPLLASSQLAIKHTPRSLQGIPEHEDSMSRSQPALVCFHHLTYMIAIIMHAHLACIHAANLLSRLHCAHTCIAIEQNCTSCIHTFNIIYHYKYCLNILLDFIFFYTYYIIACKR